jgi:hypothetical protein
MIGWSALLLAATLQGSAQQSSAAELLDRWQTGVDMIRSYEVSTELEQYSYVTIEGGKSRLLRPDEKYPPILYRSRIWRSGSKRRGEFGLKDLDGPARSLMIINGDTRMHRMSDGEVRSVNIDSELIAFGANEYEDFEATYRTVLGTLDRIVLSRGRRTVVEPRDGRFYVIATPELFADPRGWGNVRWRVWLDPKCNYLPARIRQWFISRGRTMLDREIENELAEVEPGVWVPIRSTIQVYSKSQSPADALTSGKRIGVSHLRVVMERSRFNIDLPDDLFEQKIPVGAEVVDNIRKVAYTAGSTDPDKYLAHIAATGEKAVQLLDQKGERLTVIPNDRKIRSSHVVLLGVAGAALCGAAVLLGRRRLARPARH